MPQKIAFQGGPNRSGFARLRLVAAVAAVAGLLLMAPRESKPRRQRDARLNATSVDIPCGDRAQLLARAEILKDDKDSWKYRRRSVNVMRSYTA